MTVQELHTAYETKLKTLMPYLIKTANGDEDLIQEGAIGIWESMKRAPKAPNSYYASQARWNIKSVARGVGKSVDIPKWHRRKTPISMVHYDTAMNADAIFSQAVIADRKRLEDFWKIYAVAKGQDKVMLLAFLHLAARRGEVFRMALEDVNFNDSRIRLWTRKRMSGTYEYDWLPMTQELRDALRWWCEHRPIKDKPNVFLCLETTEFTRDYYGLPFKTRCHFMRRLCNKAKVPPFGFHAIRHLSASILFNLGYDLGVIQAILRHKSPSTTERYLKSIGIERVRDALESLSSKPKAEVVNIDRVHESVFGG